MQGKELLDAVIGNDAATNLWQEVKDCCNPLHQIREMSMQQLKAIPKIGKRKAELLKAAIALGTVSREVPYLSATVENPDQSFVHFQDLWDEPVEVFAVLSLSYRHHFICRDIISRGTICETSVSPREVYLTAMKRGAARIIVAHNHPSGDIVASQNDLKLTKQLIQVGDLMNIKLLDHLIVAGNTYCSLRQSTALWD